MYKQDRYPVSQMVIEGLEEQKKYIADIRQRAGSSWKEHDLLFPNKHGGYLDHWVVLKQFLHITEQAGLPHMRIHDLRHSVASLLLAAGVNARVVQEMLGHSDIRVTLGMYGHVMPDMQQDAVNKMNDMFS
jgi:integrase